MFKGRDRIAVMLALAGVVGAVSLAGIFIVYLVDTIGGDGGGDPASQNGTTGPTGVTAPPPSLGSTGAGPTASLPGGTTLGGNGTPGAPAPGGGAGGRRNVIPDGQEFETYTNSSGGYSIDYPKDWARSGSRRITTFTSSRNYEQISVGGTVTTPASFAREIRRQGNARPLGAPEVVRLSGERVLKISYEVGSAAKEAEGLTVVVDAYRFVGKKRFITLHLATTKAAQKLNADEYERIARSFRFL
jgi:hypothetical protein